MAVVNLTAIMPVKDRAEVAASARSLLAACPGLSALLICDGGSTQPQCCAALRMLAQEPGVQVLRRPQTGFNKAELLNDGLQAARSEWVLLTDADILWSAAAIAALWPVARSPRTVATIATVQETLPTTATCPRRRYTYQLAWDNGVQVIAIVTEPEMATAARPGCGLLCARRATLLALGGYKHILTGWGWEDRDLLLRAELCGERWLTAGTVQHCSHSDVWRNQFTADSPTATRDQNIVRSLRSLEQGQFWGDLIPTDTQLATPLAPVRITWPPELGQI
ncbi:MAG: glycosyltransferase [Spirulinaceae cyanobacterium SM2_1_0]|nr:glycosyltransferase [Spirulinaceae cyanobacterium SM2_1_0]